MLRLRVRRERFVVFECRCATRGEAERRLLAFAREQGSSIGDYDVSLTNTGKPVVRR